MVDTQKLKTISYFVVSGWHKIERCYELIEEEKHTIAVAYLNQSSTLIQNAYSVYKQNFEDGESQEFESFYAQFDIFNDEVLDSVATDHGDHYISIYFEEVKERYENLPTVFKTISDSNS
ncbi:hypothetical protein [Bacillus altitudinis]|uniref:hypothetical protein n=1 Tax=Bacillus altitudinis TaxID=293387 RepID=UPI003CF04A1B